MTARELPGDRMDLSGSHHLICPHQEGFNQALFLPMAQDLFHHLLLLFIFIHGTFLLLPLNPFHQTLLDNLDLFQFTHIHLFNQDLTLQDLLGGQNPYIPLIIHILISLNPQLKQLRNLEAQPLPLWNLPPQQQPLSLPQNPPLLP